MAYWFGFAAVAGAFGGLIAFGIQHVKTSIQPWRLLFIIEVSKCLHFCPNSPTHFNLYLFLLRLRSNNREFLQSYWEFSQYSSSRTGLNRRRSSTKGNVSLRWRGSIEIRARIRGLLSTKVRTNFVGPRIAPFFSPVLIYLFITKLTHLLAHIYLAFQDWRVSINSYLPTALSRGY